MSLRAVHYSKNIPRRASRRRQAVLRFNGRYLMSIDGGIARITKAAKVTKDESRDALLNRLRQKSLEFFHTGGSTQYRMKVSTVLVVLSCPTSGRVIFSSKQPRKK